MSLTQTASELTLARKEVERLQAKLDEAKDQRDQKQSALISEMSQEGFKSIKTEDYNFAIVRKKNIRVLDEQALRADLKKRGLLDDLLIEKFDTIAFKSTANAMLKATGELFLGSEVSESEYISIKKQ